MKNDQALDILFQLTKVSQVLFRLCHSSVWKQWSVAYVFFLALKFS